MYKWNKELLTNYYNDLNNNTTLEGKRDFNLVCEMLNIPNEQEPIMVKPVNNFNKCDFIENKTKLFRKYLCDTNPTTEERQIIICSDLFNIDLKDKVEFCDVFDKRMISSASGGAYHLTSVNKTFLLCRKNNDFTLAHEIGHLKQFENISYNEINNVFSTTYYEGNAYFHELLYIEALKDIDFEQYIKGLYLYFDDLNGYYKKYKNCKDYLRKRSLSIRLNGLLLGIKLLNDYRETNTFDYSIKFNNDLKNRETKSYDFSKDYNSYVKKLSSDLM